MDVVNVRKRVDVVGDCIDELEHRLGVLTQAIHQQQGRVLAISHGKRERYPARHLASVIYMIPIAPGVELRRAASSDLSPGDTQLSRAERSKL